MPRGGHFAAFEEPELLANDIVQFVKKVEKFWILWSILKSIFNNLTATSVFSLLLIKHSKLYTYRNIPHSLQYLIFLQNGGIDKIAFKF